MDEYCTERVGFLRSHDGRWYSPDSHDLGDTRMRRLTMPTASSAINNRPAGERGVTAIGRGAGVDVGVATDSPVGVRVGVLVPVPVGEALASGWAVGEMVGVGLAVGVVVAALEPVALAEALGDAVGAVAGVDVAVLVAGGDADCVGVVAGVGLTKSSTVKLPSRVAAQGAPSGGSAIHCVSLRAELPLPIARNWMVASVPPPRRGTPHDATNRA